MAKVNKSGEFCQYYAYDNEGRRRVFAWRVTNKQDAVHCLVRMGQASGWYVRFQDGRQLVNERIFASAANPDYRPPKKDSGEPWYKDFFKL